VKYFVKAKFTPIQTVENGARATPELKERFDDRADAFQWAEKQIDAGAVSIVIRPEQ
jgi:hypothetical protein